MNNFIQDHLIELRKNNIPYPENELRILLKHSLLIDNDIFLCDFDINQINISKFKSVFKRRIQHEPISKISNQKEFWSFDFYVNKDVLDPRPESEFLINGIRKYFTDYKKNIRICDLGTGSGCLAITLAKIYKHSKIIATDISKKAILVSKINAKYHKVTNQIEFINCKWINNNSKYEIVVSNPPYLTYSQYENCDKNIKNYEPKNALLGGQDGLKSYKEISSIANSILQKKSYLFIEIGYGQKDKVINIFKKNNLKTVKIFKDYQSIDRVLVLKKDKK